MVHGAGDGVESVRLRQIEVFYAVYAHGSVSAAARALCVSQPAVSKALRQTEEGLGFLLFERVGRGLVPTEEAHRLYEEAGKVFQNVANLRRVAQNLSSALSGHLRISAITGLSFELLPRTIGRLRETFPNTTFELQTQHYGDLIASLRSYETDVGLVFSSRAHSGLQRIKLGEAEFTCVYSADRVRFDSDCVPLRELTNKDYIALNADGPLGGALWREIEKTDDWVAPAAIAESCFVAKSLAASGIGIAIVDEFTGAAGGHANLIHKRIDPPATFDVHALYVDARPLHAVGQHFLDIITTVFKEHQAMRRGQ